MQNPKEIKLLTNKETSALLGIRANTLEIWRCKGTGPRYRSLGRSIRYVESEVIAWLDQNTRQSTSEYSTHLNPKKNTTLRASDTNGA